MMYCDVKGCTRLATHLQIIEISKDRRIKFNLCAKHNKLVWKYDDHNKVVLSEEKPVD